MDVRSMCSSSSPISSDQSDKSKVSGFASHVQSLPSPPLMETVNEKKGSSLPPLTSILPPLHEINPPLPPKQPHHDTSSSSNPKSPSSRVNYPQPPVQSISQRSSLTSSSSSYSSQPSDDTTNKMWSRPPPPHPNSYYRQSFPPPPQPPPPPSSSQYSYTPQSQQPQQQSVRHYPYPSTTYPPAYATSSSYTSTGNNINGDEDEDSPYILHTVEQSLAKMGKAVDHCNQISHFITQYRDMKMNSQWNGIFPQISESTLTDMINRAFDVLNILSGLKSEISTRRSNASQGEIDLIRKQRTLGGVSTRSKYRKRSKRAAPPGRCHSCNISETPEWRRGPDGARTLCNACGLHFAKITRKRALSAMQQAEQQQQQQQVEQQQKQQQEQPQQQQVTSPSDDSNVSDNSKSISAPTTPGASDVENDNEQSIEIIDD